MALTPSPNRSMNVADDDVGVVSQQGGLYRDQFLQGSFAMFLGLRQLRSAVRYPRQEEMAENRAAVEALCQEKLQGRSAGFDRGFASAGLPQHKRAV